MASPTEEIKSRLSIVDLVQAYIKLEKAGVNFKSRCPFHNEKTPSFFVSPARQAWHCFGCQKGGDHFQFIQEIENVEFPEALRILAEKTGVELRREDPQVRSERTRLLNLLSDAAKFYEANLVRRKDVGLYLSERGMTGETAKRFRLGYAESGWENLLGHLKIGGYGEFEAEKVGLAVKKEGGGYYDRFRSRIMFPLFDSSGRVVGFSGRIFMPDAVEQKDADSKYVNTPNTIFYDKSKLLYGFDRAKLEIRKQNSAILVEGQMDLIMSHQAGVVNAAAVSGTALTLEHLRLIRRLADNLILSFDMDAAGLGASEKGVALALAQGFDVKAIALPHGKDPADLIRDNPEEWKNLADSARPVIEFLLEVLGKANRDERELRLAVEKRVLPHVAAVKSEIDRAHWVEVIARRLNLPDEPLWNSIKGLQKKMPEEQISEEAERRDFPRTRKDLIEERILGLAVMYPTIPALADCQPKWFSEGRREMFRKVLADGSTSRDTARDTLLTMGDHYLKKLALAAEISIDREEAAVPEVQSLAKELRREDVKERLVNLSSQIRAAEQGGKTEELHQRLDEFKKLSTELNAIRA